MGLNVYEKRVAGYGVMGWEKVCRYATDCVPLETKSREDEANDVRTRGRDVEWCPLNGSWVGCSDN